MSLHDELKRLAEGATPGDWEAITRLFDKHSQERPANACWPWTGATMQKANRAHMSILIGGKRRGTTAARIAYQMWKGEIPDGLFVCHSCDNPNCVNPDHLWLGDAGDNARDMWAKGRAFHPPRSKRKTHCKRGHELTPENSVGVTGGRTCRICKAAVKAEYQRAYRAKAKAARQALEATNEQ